MLIFLISGFVWGIPILLWTLVYFADFNPYPQVKVLNPVEGLLVFAGATLLSGLSGGAFYWLQALLYNLVARRPGGLKVELVRAEAQVETSVETRVLEIKYIHVISALLIGLPVALLGLLIANASFLVFSWEINFSEELVFLYLQQNSSDLLIFIRILLIWPLWALIYNQLAQRNGGLVLEVEGEWPELAEQAGAGV